MDLMSAPKVSASIDLSNMNGKEVEGFKEVNLRGSYNNFENYLKQDVVAGKATRGLLPPSRHQNIQPFNK